MADLFANGNKKEAKEIHDKLVPVYNALFEVTNPILVKAAVAIIWKDVGAPRLPLVKATEEQINKLKDIIREVEKL
jgi:4-hydroxy-tetrahydrodipicolinate synthase